MDFRIPNVYTLGQVQLNTQPLVQLQGQLLAKKQAREEALDKYFLEKTKELSKKGIANNDYDNYNKKLDNIKKYWFQNKDAIGRGGLAQKEFDSLVDDLKDFTYESINKKNDLAKVYDLVAAKKIEDDNDVGVIAKMELPVGHPDRLKPNGMPYGISDFKAFVPMPEVSEIKSFFDFTKEGMKPKEVEYEKDATGKIIYTPVGPDSFDTKVKFTERFSNDQINAMADKAAQLTAYSDKFQKYFNSYINNPTSPEFAELKQIHMQQFPGNEMDTPQEVARALAVLNAKKFVNTGEKVIPGEKKKAAYQSALISSRQGGGAGGFGAINLSEYPEVSGKGRDITDLMQGVTVFQAPDGTKLSASKVYYDPATKQVNYETLVGRDESGKIVKGAPKALSLNTFLQNIKTLNPGTDFKFVETLGAARVPGKSKPKPTRPPLDSFIKK